ncbi:MAG TPA: YfhO family protein, partial [Pyrinomonadaceae bacterium]|nr:YfhO family protein [Pyrinomonadaceae bacterium]
QYAIERGVEPSALSLSNPAITTPLVIFLLGAAVLFFWRGEPTSIFRSALVLAILLIDLASFGWFFSWHDFAPRKEVLNAPASAAKYRELLDDSRQRMISIRGTLGTLDELPPNLSRVWGVTNATGYGPLLPSRLLYLLSILPDGSIASSWKDVDDQSLNLSSVRYAFLPRSELKRDARGVKWDEENMGLWLGSGCDHPPRASVRFNLTAPFRATSVGVVSRLACSVPVKDGEEMARAVLTDVDGNIESQSILAGRDSSEWSYDCPNIKPKIQHSRAEVFESFPAKMYEASCEGHFYVATLHLNSIRAIRSVEIQWTGRTSAITIEKLSLIDELENNSEAINPLSIEGSQWRFVEESGSASIYENLKAMPRAWLTPEVVRLKPEEILDAIKRSKLPDGRVFDPARVALVEDALSLPALEGVDSSALAQITQYGNTFMEVETKSTLPSFLVTSDLYYPGWRATLDGAPAQLLRADYAFRGVQVPAGRHRLRFEFTPKTFYYGLGLSVISLCALIGFLVFAFPHLKPEKSVILS